jgi:hypothetical protein
MVKRPVCCPPLKENRSRGDIDMTNGTQELGGPVCGASDPLEEVTSTFVPGWGVLPELDAADLSEHRPQVVMKSGNPLVDFKGTIAGNSFSLVERQGCNDCSTGKGFSLAKRQSIMPELPSKILEASNTGFCEIDPTWPNLEEVSLWGGLDKRLVLDGSTAGTGTREIGS